MVCATPVRQDISIVWFDMMSVCNISLRQSTSIWNQHGLISVWYDVISVTHDRWINYVSHHDIEDKMMWYVTSIGNSYHIMLTWYHTDMSHIVSNPIPSHHRITSSHPIPLHHITLHHHIIPSHQIPPHHITSSHLITTSSRPITSAWHTWYHTGMSHHIVSCHISHHITPHHITPSHPSIT